MDEAMNAETSGSVKSPEDSGNTSWQVEAALVKAARSLTERLDTAAVCQAVLDAVETVFDARSAWVLLYDPQSKQLRTCAVRGGGSEAFRGLAIAPDVGILGLAFTTQKVVFIPKAQEEARWFDPARVHAADLQSVFAVPLVHGSEILGVVGLDSPMFSAARPPTGAHLGQLEALAAQAAIAISNARLYSTSEEDRRRLRMLLAEQRRLRDQVTHLEQQVKTAGGYKEIIGESAGMKETLRQASLAAPGDTTILLLGETGSGKELIAHYVHEHSTRRRGPFVAVNCAALPESLLESELFGHERGAFTGALARKLGKFEVAQHGTLFLDEVGDLPLEAQAKLLRVLQDGQVQRVGSTQSTQIDVRVVAATNQDLEAAVAEHRFRSDLFFRISVFPIKIPPLRDRDDDVALLARYYIDYFASRLRKSVSGMAPAVQQRLRDYDWPGNVRELQNVIERAVILTSGPTIEPDAITVSKKTPPPVDDHAPGNQPRGVVALAEAERRAILAALLAANWRVSGRGAAAERLGLKPTTLHAKMKKLGIRRPA